MAAVTVPHGTVTSCGCDRRHTDWQAWAAKRFELDFLPDFPKWHPEFKEAGLVPV